DVFCSDLNEPVSGNTQNLQCAQKLPETGSFYRPSGILSFALQTGPPHAKTSVVMSHQEAEGQPGTLAETVLADSCFKTQRRKPMKPSTNDQIEGQLHELYRRA